MGRKKATEEHAASEEKPMSKSAAVRLAIEELGQDAPYADIIEWCKAKGIEVNAGNIGNVKTAMKGSDGGSKGKSGGSGASMADFVEGLTTLKALAADMDKEMIRGHLAGLRKFLGKFSDGDIDKLLELI